MNTKFTKGEWKIEPESDNNIWIVTDNSIEAIAMVCSGYNDVTKKYEPEETELANAKLIAAAPELFDALYDLIQAKGWKDKNGKDEHYLKVQPIAWENAKKAINKVTK